MSWAAVAVGGATLVSGVIGSKSQEDAAAQQAASGEAAIAEQREARESFEERVQPFTEFGYGAASSLAELLGIAPPPTQQEFDLQKQIEALDAEIAAGPQSRRVSGGKGKSGLEGTLYAATGLAGERGFKENVRAGLSLEGPLGYEGEREQLPFDEGALTAKRGELAAQLEAMRSQRAQQAPSLGGQLPGEQDRLLQQINPLVGFLRQEGFEDIQESAAARGRLGAGGTLKDLTQFNTQLTSTIIPQLQEQRFNQLFNVLGLGQSSAVGQGTAALQTAGNIGNLQTAIGAA